jgi:pimeloyl-ACP methyl ester carboxylesterase
MSHVVSADGTPIAYDRAGDGPAVVLVGGGLDDGAENGPLAAELAARFTVHNYARRGRAGSGDTQPYAVAREIEDLTAVVAAAGGSAHVVGVSSGGALALEAAAAGAPIDRLAVYEVPYLSGDLAHAWAEYVEDLRAALAEDRRGDALALFMRLAGASEADVAGARASSLWRGLEALAHTLAYDAAVLGDGTLPAARLARVEQPVLVLTGADAGYFEPAADAIAAALRDATRRALPEHGHVADPVALSRVLAEFFGTV